LIAYTINQKLFSIVTNLRLLLLYKFIHQSPNSFTFNTLRVIVVTC